MQINALQLTHKLQTKLETDFNLRTSHRSSFVICIKNIFSFRIYSSIQSERENITTKEWTGKKHVIALICLLYKNGIILRVFSFTPFGWFTLAIYTMWMWVLLWSGNRGSRGVSSGRMILIILRSFVSANAMLTAHMYISCFVFAVAVGCAFAHWISSNRKSRKYQYFICVSMTRSNVSPFLWFQCIHLFFTTCHCCCIERAHLTTKWKKRDFLSIS